MTPDVRPGAEPAFTPRTPRVVAARALRRRRDRDSRRQFLAEGPQAVREAVAARAVVELFGTAEALDRQEPITGGAVRSGARISVVTAAGLAALAETQHPQGLVAVCRHRDLPLPAALDRRPRLVAVLYEISDPGNAGTILRTADAAGAQLVVFAGDTVDPYNGKCVRASAGSVFHVDLVRAGPGDPAVLLAQLRSAGLQVLAAHPRGAENLDDLARAGSLGPATAWLFGSEAHGLPEDLAGAADARVRVPIHGRAESLNLAAAAAVCLYTSATAQHQTGESPR